MLTTSCVESNTRANIFPSLPIRHALCLDQCTQWGALSKFGGACDAAGSVCVGGIEAGTQVDCASAPAATSRYVCVFVRVYVYLLTQAR